MAEDLGERTEPATERRREEARRRGQVAVSRDFSSAVVLLAAVVGLQFWGEAMLADAVRAIRFCFDEPWMLLSPDLIRVELIKITLLAMQSLAFWTGFLLLVALVVNLAQTGLEIASERSFLEFGKLNPISGFQRIFSIRGLVKTALDVLKVMILGLIAYLFIDGELFAFAGMSMMEFPAVAGYAIERSMTLAYQLVAALMALGIADYAYQRFQFERDLRMTRQEVKEETKDIEGDPMIRARRRQIQARLARQRILQQVPEAEVVITNPTELAIAIKYKADEMDAPVIVAKGAGIIAQKIREIAAEHNIPLIENKPLARLLFYKADLDRVIPEETFVAVAEILAYVYQLTGRKVPSPPS
ncbi:MAG: flagellar biosynthesis protein FlhB [Planctomycetota bacterium]